MEYLQLDKDALREELREKRKEYERIREKDLKLDMSRGKPAADQLNLSDGMLNILTHEDCVNHTIDYRNYGIFDGIPEAKEIFCDLLGAEKDEIMILGNSSLNIMYDAIIRSFVLGVNSSCPPWSKLEKVKFLCPVPGYDRHFRICERMGIEMINIDMTPDGPDMDTVERLVSEDETIKGIWCVPKYSNPGGVTYSDETVRRFANLKPKAGDFRIFWDNAYCIHDLYDDGDKLLNLFEECKKAGNPSLPYIFGSTSKITYPGAGVAFIIASKNNIRRIVDRSGAQTIGYDKLNQLRHVKFFKNADGIKAHMKKHAELIRPKFETVISALEREFGENKIAEWTNPKGGYFVSVNLLDGCAKRTVELCAEAGVVLTGAGATFPYGKDPRDRNIRIAPTFPTVAELSEAVEVFCLAVKLATLEKLLNI